MEDAIGKVFAFVLVVAAIVFDWPRAVAGLAAGYVGRRSGYPWIAIPLGVVAIAAAGELIYPLIGRTDAMSWGSFTIGLVAAGATAIGLFRVLWNIADPSSS